MPTLRSKNFLNPLKIIAVVIFFQGLIAEAKTYNLEYEHVPNQLIIKFKNTISLREKNDVFSRFSLTPFYTFSNGAFLVSAPTEAKVQRLHNHARRLDALSIVDYVEANTVLHIDRTIPNDTLFNELYGLYNTGSNGGTVGADIGAVKAWNKATGSKKVLVAIIDTGIDYNHPDLAANYWTNPGEIGLDANGNDKRTNNIDDDGNGYVDDSRGWDFANSDNDPFDDHGHGTHCAGTIGAVGNNSQGVVGVNWEVSFVALKFLTGSGSGTLADAVRAIEYATKIKATLTSNSWGGGGYSETMESAIRQAGEAGILFVAAAGNDSADNDVSPHFPSNYDLSNIIAVAATDNKDALASFSCFGKTAVDLGAPGVDILSAAHGNSYKKMSGTSMATPHVAGAAALVKSLYPGLESWQIKLRLLNSVDVIPSLRGKVLTNGRLNVANALEKDDIPPSAITDLGIVSAGLTSLNIKWKKSGDDGTIGDASGYFIRYADSPINNESDWTQAKNADFEIKETQGQYIFGQVNKFPLNKSGFLAIKAVDNVGNISSLGESKAFQLKQARVLASFSGDSMEGLTADPPWGLELMSPGDNYVFSDSPGGNYGNSINLSLTLPNLQANPGEVILTYKTKYQIEKKYDNGYVEISSDNGQTWQTIAQYTDESDWLSENLSLSQYIPAKEKRQIKIRFRFKTDNTVNKNGWWLDDIMIFDAKP